jgi:hypothetical protein
MFCLGRGLVGNQPFPGVVDKDVVLITGFK